MNPPYWISSVVGTKFEFRQMKELTVVSKRSPSSLKVSYIVRRWILSERKLRKQEKRSSTKANIKWILRAWFRKASYSAYDIKVYIGVHSASGSAAFGVWPLAIAFDLVLFSQPPHPTNLCETKNLLFSREEICRYLGRRIVYPVILPNRAALHHPPTVYLATLNHFVSVFFCSKFLRLCGGKPWLTLP